MYSIEETKTKEICHLQVQKSINLLILSTEWPTGKENWTFIFIIFYLQEKFFIYVFQMLSPQKKF